MIVTTGSFIVAIVDDIPALAGARAPLRSALPVGGGGRTAEGRRAVVELAHKVSGNPQHALLGGVWLAREGASLEVLVPTGIPTLPTSDAWCTGPLGRSLIPGLPDEFALAVRATLEAAIPVPGVLTVDRAAYDPVESSPAAFRTAATVLAAVLMAEPSAAADAASSVLAAL